MREKKEDILEYGDNKVSDSSQKNEYSVMPYKNKNFIKIIDFYLFNCPARHTYKLKDLTGKNEYNFSCSKVSARGKTFAERGIEGGALRALRAAMKRTSY